jgi:hypothetical protein
MRAAIASMLVAHGRSNRAGAGADVRGPRALESRRCWYPTGRSNRAVVDQHGDLFVSTRLSSTALSQRVLLHALLARPASQLSGDRGCHHPPEAGLVFFASRAAHRPLPLCPHLRHVVVNFCVLAPARVIPWLEEAENESSTTDANLCRAARACSPRRSRHEDRSPAREGRDSTGLPKAGWWVARARREAVRTGISQCGFARVCGPTSLRARPRLSLKLDPGTTSMLGYSRGWETADRCHANARESCVRVGFPSA